MTRSRISLLESEPGRKLPREFLDRNGGYVSPPLPDDPWVKPWRDLVRRFHDAGFTGTGQTIGIIDSGYLPDHPVVRKAVAAEHDLTGEGIADTIGHGTMVSLLALAVAPDAKLVHVKLFGRDGRCAGASEGERCEAFVKAIEKAGDLGANIINISAGLGRDPQLVPEDASFLEGDICNCSICFSAEETAQRCQATIVVAAGNKRESVWRRSVAPRLRRIGLTRLARWMEAQGPSSEARMCPASAAEVLPVVGIVAGNRLAEPRLPMQMEHLIEHVGAFPYLGRHGSSFAAPLVSGTAALFAELFGGTFADWASKKGRPDIGAPRALFRRSNRGMAATYLLDLAYAMAGRSMSEGVVMLSDMRTNWPDLDENLRNLVAGLVEKRDFVSAERACRLLLGMLTDTLNDGQDRDPRKDPCRQDYVDATALFRGVVRGCMHLDATWTLARLSAELGKIGDARRLFEWIPARANDLLGLLGNFEPGTGTEMPAPLLRTMRAEQAALKERRDDASQWLATHP